MKKIYLHAMPVRIWHWINVLCFVALIVTGIQIRYRDMMNLTSFKNAVNIHNIFGFLTIANFFIWALYYLLSGKIKVYIPDPDPKKFIQDSINQARYYGYGIFMGEKNPHTSTPDNKFNPMQQVAYFNIMLFLIPLQGLTGLFLWDLKRFASLIALAGGLKMVASIHMFLSIFFASFMIVHVYLATLGHTPLAHMKAMFTGYEEEEEHAH